MRVASLDQHIRLGADHEESGAECKNKEPLEINVASVHDVEGACLCMISSRMFTSCTSPLVTRMNVGMLPCKSSRVCILTAALRCRNFAHGNSDRHRSMVVESRAYR